MASVTSYSGDFTLEKIEIIAVDGNTVDITLTVVSVTIFEDTFNSALHGEIMFGDNFNLQNSMPLIGQELLSMKIKTPVIDDDDTSIDFTQQVFALFELTNSTIVDENNQMHTMKFISMEHYRNNRTKI